MTPHTALRACIEALELTAAEHENDAVPLARIAAVLAAARAALEAQAEPVAWRITDGEGGWTYYDEEPDEFAVSWAARYGRKHQPLYAAPAQPAEDVCWCDQQGIGEPGVSCGDCPTRDYKSPAAQPATVPALTESEIKLLFHAARNAKLGAAQDNSKHRLSVVEIARAVERACAEKWGHRLEEPKC